MAELTKEDFTSPTWLRLRKYCERRLDELRRKNDGLLSADDTARLRGRIAQLKEIQALADQPPPAETNDT